jgi:hypothetical protein
MDVTEQCKQMTEKEQIVLLNRIEEKRSVRIRHVPKMHPSRHLQGLRLRDVREQMSGFGLRISEKYRKEESEHRWLTPGIGPRIMKDVRRCWGNLAMCGTDRRPNGLCGSRP